jgi:hypothetical protein
MKLKSPRKARERKHVTAATGTYLDLTQPGKAKFVLADGSTREVAWIETHSLPAVKVQAVIEKAARDNDDAIASYNYDLPTLVKLQEAQIAMAALVVSRLGEIPNNTDVEIIRFAMTDIRDLLPGR